MNENDNKSIQPVIIKQYELTDKIGCGGMGEVYKAYDTILERDVAIKIMHPHLLNNQQNKDRLMREARSAAKLIHSNVVTIHEIGEDDHGNYIVMEYVPGTPLSQFIYENDVLDPVRAIKIVNQLLKALQLAHCEGILHRDIKADNILITTNDKIKILDFGIAKLTKQDTLTAVGEVLGTIEYMAPEQMMGEAVDSRCDLYSAGIVLYQLLTRQLPHTGDSPVQILFNKLNEEPIYPSEYNPKIKKTLNEIVLKSIHHDKDQRWTSAEDFYNALNSHLSELTTPQSSKKETGIDFDFDIDEEDADGDTSLREVFIGRKKEFSKLVTAFQKAKNGNGQTVIIKGEAGVGKTSLANKFCAYAEYSDGWILSGACLYQEGMDAYLPFIDAIRKFFSKENTHLKEQDRIALKNLVKTKVPVLAQFTDRFTTTIISPEMGKEVQDQSNNNNIYEDFTKFVDIVSSICPIVIVIDDLQWADAASLRLFHYLSSHINKFSVVLLGISRSDRYDLQENGKPTYLTDILARMHREDLFEYVDLNKFSRENSDQLINKVLVNTALSDEFYDEIFHETKGNPFFILETVKSLQENGGITLENGIWIDTHIDFKMEVPSRVEDIFIRRLSTITDEEREILQVAAVAGYKFDPLVVGNILEIPKIRLLKILERMERELGLIHSDSKLYRFEHPMLADLLYNEISSLLCQEYHLLIAEYLNKVHGSKLDSMTGDAAEHYRKGGNIDKAIPLLYQAGMRAFKIFAYRESSLFFEHLLDILDENEIQPDKDMPLIDLYFKLGICYEEVGRWQEGIETYHKLANLAQEQEDFDKQANAVMRIGRLHDKLGKWNLVMDSYEKCLELADTHDLKNIKSRIYNNMGIYFFHKGDLDSALDHFQESITKVDSERGEFDKAHAYTNIGIIANILRGPNSVALDNFKKALEIYEKKNSTRNIARVYQNIGMVYSDRGDWTQAIEAFENCLKFTTETDEKQLRSLCYLNLGKTYARQRNQSKAKSYTEKALKMCRRMHDVLGIAEAYHIYSIIYGNDQEFNKAEKYLEESIKINKEKDFQDGLAETYETYARLALNTGKITLSKDYCQKAMQIYKIMNVDVKVKELQDFSEQIDNEKVGKFQTQDNKLLTRKYGTTVRHS